MFISVSLVLILLLGIGISYSMWNITTSQDTTNTAYTKCFDVSITNQKNSIDLENTYPISDEKGKKLTPFSFTITNTCDIFASYTVNLESLKDTTLNSKFLKVMLNNEGLKLLSNYESTDTVNTGSIESHILAKGSLGSGDSEDYTLRLWIDYDTTLDDLDNEPKTFKSKIVVKAQPSTWNPIKEGYTTLHDAILANEYQTSPEASIKKIEAKGTPDLSNTAPIIKWIEKTGESATKEVIKPAESAIKSDNQTSNLTENDTLLKLYKTKTFNEETAYYALSDPVYIDPTTVDDSNKYYYCDENITTYNNTGSLYTNSCTSSRTIYEVKNASKTETKSTWNNVEYNSITYKLNLISLTSVELEVDKSDKGLYKDTDDYGTTYYYRGNVKNNIVYFAGFYWQIVRINGDGSIRLIYDGTEKNATGVKQSINNKTYQFNSLYNDPTYVGYMYGNSDGTTFDEVHNNTNNSTIKTAVDNWYKTNIVDKGYSDKVATSVGFCGDRTLHSGDGISNNVYSYFGAYGRYINKTAQFTCPNIERDLYTTTDSSIGNKALTYPVGLITYDEIVFAGMDKSHINKLSYVYSTQNIWTMSSSSFNATYGGANECGENNTGYLTDNRVTNSFGARPVINLRSNSKITGGIGTTNEPFIIDTN